jgi:hypothetical protein
MTENNIGLHREVVGQASGIKPRCAGRIWLWFAIGFLVVFLGMAFFVWMNHLALRGDAVVHCRLWEYYVIELRRAGNPFGYKSLGPATGSGTPAIETAVFHVLFSVMGGGVAMGIGWRVRKGKRSQCGRAA